MKLDDYSLRRVHKGDVDKIYNWRNSPWIRNNMLDSNPIKYQDHLKWFERIQDDPENLVFIGLYKGEEIGVVTFYRTKNKVSDFGLYLASPNLPKGTGKRLGFTGLDFGFTNLELQEVKGLVLSHNKKVLNMDQYLGFVIKGCIEKNDKGEEILELYLTRSRWLSRKAMIQEDLDQKIKS